MTGISTPIGSVSIERLEAGLDRLAAIMVAYGPGAETFLPLFQRLEAELDDAIRRGDGAATAMAAVHARLRRCQDRRAARP